MQTGTAVRWDIWKGFGFLEPDDGGAQVYVHVTKLDGFQEHVRYLADGEKVRFDAVPGQPAPDGSPRQEAQRVSPPPDRVIGTVIDYSFLKGHGIIDGADGTRYFLHHRNMLGEGMKNAEPGDHVTFVPGEEAEEEGRFAAARSVKLSDPRKPLYRFAGFPTRPESWLDPLKAIAEPEKWEFQHELAGRGGHLPILRHYIEETYSRLEDEAKAGRRTTVETERDGGKLAIFNTGLLSRSHEPIYATFVEHRDPERTPWFFRGFAEESARELGGLELPPAADYLGAPGHLIITPDAVREMRVDYTHIIDDNLDRFPAPLRDDANLADAVLRGDIRRLPERIRRNYKAATPQLYRGQIQLLLPLDLVSPRGRTDLVLVVERADAGHRASTVLGVDMAYRQARLIARPDPEWLGRAWFTTD